jgi:hypothetical protein
MCPSTPALFGDLDNFRCVSKCPRERYAFFNNTYRACVTTCPAASATVDLYGDNTTWSCVRVCPRAMGLFAFKHPNISTIRKCVSTCPVFVDPSTNISTFYFADNVTQSCLLACPLKNLTWADQFTLKC